MHKTLKRIHLSPSWKTWYEYVTKKYNPCLKQGIFWKGQGYFWYSRQLWHQNSLLYTFIYNIIQLKLFFYQGHNRTCRYLSISEPPTMLHVPISHTSQISFNKHKIKHATKICYPISNYFAFRMFFILFAKVCQMDFVSTLWEISSDE